MSKKNGLTLRITAPDGTVVESTSDQDSIILGSGAGAAVQLADPRVSNLHVLLKVDAQAGQVMAIDLGSEAGTCVGANRVRITHPVSLSDGEVLLVGGTEVRVHLGAARAATRASGAMASAANGGSANSVDATVNTVRPVPAAQPVQARAAAPAPRKAPAPVRPLPTLAARGPRRAPLRFDEATPAGTEPTQAERALQVAMLWGGDALVDVQHFKDGARATVGEGRQADFTLYGESVGPLFTLVENKGGSATLHVPQGAQARVARVSAPGQAGTLQAASGAVELGLLDRAEVQLENVALVVRYIRPGTAVVAGGVKDGDFTFFKIASVCLLVFFALVAAVMLAPPPEPGMSDDIFANKAEVARLLIKPQKTVDVERFKAAAKKTGADEGEKAKGDEGRFGKPEATQKTADASKKGAPVVDKNKREADRKKVMSAGLLGALGGGAASDVLGPGGLGSGLNNALGGLTGGQGMGDQAGVGGLGARGTGTGGGGKGLGIGGLGTRGDGAGGPGGGGGLGLGARGKEITRVIPGKTTVVGGLDKEVIMQVIRRHHNEIKFCYEKELQKAPNLGGKVAVQWTIEASGQVSDTALAESTMGSSNVEQCILSRVRRWKFPEARNGGSTVVTFPWVFKAAGDE